MVEFLLRGPEAEGSSPQSLGFPVFFGRGFRVLGFLGLGFPGLGFRV